MTRYHPEMYGIVAREPVAHSSLTTTRRRMCLTPLRRALLGVVLGSNGGVLAYGIVGRTSSEIERLGDSGLTEEPGHRRLFLGRADRAGFGSSRESVGRSCPRLIHAIRLPAIGAVISA